MVGVDEYPTPDVFKKINSIVLVRSVRGPQKKFFTLDHSVFEKNVEEVDTIHNLVSLTSLRVPSSSMTKGQWTTDSR